MENVIFCAVLFVQSGGSLLKCSMYKLVQGSMSVSKEGGKSINQIYSCGMSLVLILKLLLYQKQINCTRLCGFIPECEMGAR